MAEKSPVGLASSLPNSILVGDATNAKDDTVARPVPHDRIGAARPMGRGSPRTSQDARDAR